MHHKLPKEGVSNMNMDESYPERVITDGRQINRWLREKAFEDPESRLISKLSMAKIPSLFTNLFVAISLPDSGIDPERVRSGLRGYGISDELIADFEAAILRPEPDNIVELPSRDGEVTEGDPQQVAEAEKDIA